jgi:prophage antirepressor-like protein
MIRMLDDDEQGVHKLDSRSSNGVIQSRDIAIISESGLFHVIIKSRRPDAAKFRKWVTAEVLPALRRDGFYQMPRNAEKAELAKPVRGAGRGRLSSVDRLEAKFPEELAWVKAELVKRVASQSDLLSELNARLAAKSGRPITKSAFHRFAMRESAEVKRIAQFKAMAGELNMLISAEDEDAMMRGTALLVAANLIENLNHGGDPSDMRRTALSLKWMQDVLQGKAKKGGKA